jgi:hypothetical protein
MPATPERVWVRSAECDGDRQSSWPFRPSIRTGRCTAT